MDVTADPTSARRWTAVTLTCALLALQPLKANTSTPSVQRCELESLEEKREAFREKMRSAFDHYCHFLIHFANSEYGSAFVAYSNTLKSIRATYRERKALHLMGKGPMASRSARPVSPQEAPPIAVEGDRNHRQTPPST